MKVKIYSHFSGLEIEWCGQELSHVLYDSNGLVKSEGAHGTFEF